MLAVHSVPWGFFYHQSSSNFVHENDSAIREKSESQIIMNCNWNEARCFFFQIIFN